MTVEAATHLAQLNASYPANGDSIPEGDDHIRLLKSCLLTTFSGFTGAAVTVTEAQLNTVTSRSLRAGDTYTGTHTFTGATITVPTAAVADSSTNAASTAYVMTAIAAVNAVSSVTFSINPATAFSVSAGQIVAATNAAAVAVTFPASPSVGAVCGVHFDNGLVTNTVNLGSNSVKGWNGVVRSGVITIDSPIPVVWRWGGDYWRAV